MSRIGKRPIQVPAGVDVKLDGRHIAVKGPKGRLEWDVCDGVDVHVAGGAVSVARAGESRAARSRHGLARTLIANMINGVNTGYTRRLLINGVEYRVEQKGRYLTLALGYSHPIEYELPEGVDAKVDRSSITLSSHDKQLLGAVAAEIRALRPVEPYKGKGIQYEGEYVRRKEGKAGATG
jgi:large subunit ribosomal protein L6